MLIRKRNWVVLRKQGDLWEQFTAQYAHSRKAAIDQALAGTDWGPGEYVAVPARYWRRDER